MNHISIKLESERCDECTNFTIMCALFILSVWYKFSVEQVVKEFQNI